MGIQRESAELAAVVEETVAGVRVVKGFGAEAVQRDRLQVEADDIFRESMQAARVRARFAPALDLLPNIGLIATLGYGGHQVLDGHLSLGGLVAFNVYVVMLIWPLRMLGNIIAQGQRSAASAERVDEILATDPGVAEPTDAVALPPAGAGGSRGEVRFEGVRFAYGPGLPTVLAGLDLTIPAGQSIALVGATGSGKTTVARILPRFYDVDAGAVVLDGVDVRQLRLRQLRKAIGIVFEETFLFSDTIGANIAFADPDASAASVERAARLAGAHEFITALPDGYATTIGERGYSLSGGQRQRIAIARAILADPRVLILDDATSSVDPTKEHEIRDALGEVMLGRTTLVIAHRPATIALADRVVLLGNGVVVADGTHAELLRTSAAYREVLAAAERREAEARAAAADAGAEPEGVR
jgi:ATP-binding cassette subfamily B protein